MAQSFTSVPGIISFTTGSADVLTQINFPNNCRRARITFSTNAGKITTDGTDGGAIGATAYWPAAADTEVSVFVDQDPVAGQKGPRSIFVTSATGSTTVTVICETASTTLATVSGGGGGGGTATTQIAQRGVTIAPNNTIDIRFTIPIAATILSIGVIADDTAPSSAAGTYTLAVVKDPSGTNTNLLNAATYDLDGTLTVGTLAKPTLTGTTADLNVTADTTVELSFVSNNVDLVGAGLRCMVVYRGT